MKIKLVIWGSILISLVYLTGCTHTVQGMRQDIHEASAPDQPKKSHTKKITVITSPQSSLPSSPPPLETPPSQ